MTTALRVLALGGCVSMAHCASETGTESMNAELPLGTSHSIWSDTDRPRVASDPDGAAVELGVKFRSDVAGVITGIRFYKGAGNTGMHTGTLWSRGGVKLATATYSQETASGWQRVSFARPIAIRANRTYVASYHTATGHYAGDNDAFAAAGVDRAPLHALRDGADGPSGVYQYGSSAFPTSSYRASNYWVDVVFEQGSPTDAGVSDPPVTPDAGTPGADAAPSTSDAGQDAAVADAAVPGSGSAWTRGLAWYQASTGVPAGTTLKPASGMTITTAGTVLDGLDVAGGIQVNARNVVIRNSRVRGTISNEIGDATSNLLIEHSEIDLSAIPIDSTGNSNKYGVAAWMGVTVRFAQIHGMAQGVAFVGHVTVEDSWIYGIRSQGMHSECILSNGSTDPEARSSAFRRNWLDADSTYAAGFVSSAMSLYGDFGTNRDVVIDGNFLTGDGYLLYPGATSGKPYPLPDNIQVTNNVFDPKGYGPVYPSALDPLSTAAWAGNVLVSGAIVPAPTGNR